MNYVGVDLHKKSITLCVMVVVDAKVLAEFLALDMIPEAYRPTPRIRQYRVLVRHRHWVQGLDEY